MPEKTETPITADSDEPKLGAAFVTVSKLPCAALFFSRESAEEEHALELAINVAKIVRAIDEYRERLRRVVKYGSEEDNASFSAQKAREWLAEALNNCGVAELICA